MITGIFYPDGGDIILDGKPFNSIDDIQKLDICRRKEGCIKNENWRAGLIPSAIKRFKQSGGY